MAKSQDHTGHTSGAASDKLLLKKRERLLGGCIKQNIILVL